MRSLPLIFLVVACHKDEPAKPSPTDELADSWIEIAPGTMKSWRETSVSELEVSGTPPDEPIAKALPPPPVFK